MATQGIGMDEGRRRLLHVALVAAAVVLGGCDDDPVDDESDSGRDVPVVVDGCPNEASEDASEDALVPIGETRTCECDDGSDSTQVCLSSGEYGLCDCAGGGW